MVDAPAALGQRRLAVAQRAAVEGLDERDVGLAQKRAEQPGREVRGEILAVGVDEADELPRQRRQRAPHRVALAEHRTLLGHQLGLLQHDRAGALGDPRGAVARGGVDDHDLIEHAARAKIVERGDDRSHGGGALPRGQADRHAQAALRSRGGELLGRVARMVERARLRRAPAGGAVHRLYYRKPWPSRIARSSPGARCWTRGSPMGDSCARRAKGPGARASWRPRASCIPTCSPPWSALRSTSSTPTRRRRSTPPGRGRRSSPRAPRRASRCASTCRRSTCSAETRAREPCTCIRRRRSRRTRRARWRRSA